MNARTIPLIILLMFTSGCVTIAGDKLRDLDRATPAAVPTVEQTVGDFSFHLDGGKMITSNKAGRMVNDEVLSRWKRWGYVKNPTYVKSGKFSGAADYEITLSGKQEGESSIFLQIISGLSLVVIPYYVDTWIDASFDVRDRRSGKTYHAQVRDSFNTVISLLLVPISPFAQGGRSRTWDRIAENLYSQLKAQGAFSETVLAAAL